MGNNLQDSIRLFQSLELVIIPTKNKKAYIKNWVNLLKDKPYRPRNLESNKEAGFVIPESIVVIDVDPRNYENGIDSLEQLSEKINFDLIGNASYIVHTASGGYHLYYSKTPNVKLRSSPSPGIELKSKGRQVVIAGSILPDGRKYTLDTNHNNLEKLNTLPDSFYELTDITNYDKSYTVNALDNFTDTPADISIVTDILQNAAPAIQNENGDHTTYKICCIGREYALSPQVFYPLLAEWNNRCSPPWDENDLKTKMHNAYQYALQPLGSKTLETMFALPPEKPLDTQNIIDNEQLIDWRLQLAVGKNGGYHKTLKNAVLLISHNELIKGKLAYNRFLNSIVWLSPPPWRNNVSAFNIDYDGVKIRMLLNEENFDIPKLLIYDAVIEIASKNAFHPVKDWLTSLPPWDGVKRIETMLIDCFKTPDTYYYREIMRKFMAGLLKRIYHPGAKFDFMLVLSGISRAGKSTFLKSLVPFEKWFISRQLKKLDPKDYVPLLKGKLIFEWQELAMFNKHDINAIKTFISTEIDITREAFRHDASAYPRQFMICGTTNKDQFLYDETGNERFFIVKIENAIPEDGYTNINQVLYVSHIYNNINQIYAEALTFYETENINLSSHAKKEIEVLRDDAFQVDEYEEIISEWLDNRGNKSVHVQAQDIIINCLKEPVGYTKGLSTRIGAILRRLGYRLQSYRTENGKVVKGFIKTL